jgi:hypothetical protein
VRVRGGFAVTACGMGLCALLPAPSPGQAALCFAAELGVVMQCSMRRMQCRCTACTFIGSALNAPRWTSHGSRGTSP